MSDHSTQSTTSGNSFQSDDDRAFEPRPSTHPERISELVTLTMFLGPAQPATDVSKVLNHLSPAVNLEYLSLADIILPAGGDGENLSYVTLPRLKHLRLINSGPGTITFLNHLRIPDDAMLDIEISSLSRDSFRNLFVAINCLLGSRSFSILSIRPTSQGKLEIKGYLNLHSVAKIRVPDTVAPFRLSLPDWGFKIYSGLASVQPVSGVKVLYIGNMAASTTRELKVSGLHTLLKAMESIEILYWAEVEPGAQQNTLHRDATIQFTKGESKIQRILERLGTIADVRYRQELRSVVSACAISGLSVEDYDLKVLRPWDDISWSPSLIEKFQVQYSLS